MPDVEISIVSPVYRAERLVDALVEELRQVLAGLAVPYEIILVEDGSPDASWAAITRACNAFPEVVGVRLSRNFGQHHAISAGLRQARGKWIVVMDCDLQDRPDQIPLLLEKAKEGYDVVLARRATRHDSWTKRAGSWLFYGVLGYLTGLRQDPAIANFGAYRDHVVAAINAMPETVRYFPAMVQWVGFRSTAVDVVHAARPEGGSSYTLGRLVHLAIDVYLAYSDKPLRLVVMTGFGVSLIGFVFAVFTVVQAFRGKIAVLGYASIIVSIWLLAGLVIVIMGVVGLYVGKAFEGVKGRPPFIIAEEVRSGGPHA